MPDKTDSKAVRRTVPAHLQENTPAYHGLFHWILSAPFWLYAGWLWLDLFTFSSPIPGVGLNYLLGGVIYLLLILAPLGYGAHHLVTGLPGLFQNAGWDVTPLEPVSHGELYLVRYRMVSKSRAAADWGRIVSRVGQGLVYVEIALIFIGAIVMIPLFFSATEFGFGR